jgi:hypothetical protein
VGVTIFDTLAGIKEDGVTMLLDVAGLLALTPIIGRAQLAGRRVTDPQVRAWLGAIERAGLDGAQTVWRIQDFIRIGPDAFSVPVDVNTLVRAAAVAGRAQASPSIAVTTDLGAPPDIPGDPGALREETASAAGVRWCSPPTARRASRNSGPAPSTSSSRTSPCRG